MRIFKVGFDVRTGDTFRVGHYIGMVIFGFKSWVLVKDMNNGAKTMKFHFYNDLT